MSQLADSTGIDVQQPGGFIGTPVGGKTVPPITGIYWINTQAPAITPSPDETLPLPALDMNPVLPSGPSSPTVISVQGTPAQLSVLSTPTSADVGIAPAVTSSLPVGAPSTAQSQNTTGQIVPGSSTSLLGDLGAGILDEASAIAGSPTQHLFAVLVIGFVVWWFFFKRKR